MTRSVVWTDRAEAQLLGLPLRDADLALKAVERFASNGLGFVRRMLPSNELRLYAGNCVVLFSTTPDRIIIEEVR